MKKFYSKLFALLCPLLFVCIIARSQESKFHAIFLYKFIENVSWPDSRKNLVIGIVGETEMQPELEKMLKVRGNGNFILKKISSGEASWCDVIFVPESQNSNFSSLVEKTNGKSILIITEASDLVKKGAGISFMKDGSKLTFAINKSALDSRSLKVTSTLLMLSKQI